MLPPCCLGFSKSLPPPFFLVNCLRVRQLEDPAGTLFLCSGYQLISRLEPVVIRRSTLFWDGTGLVVLHKRLETGLFSTFNRLWGNQIELTAAEFALFLEGTDLSKRFIESPQEFRFESKNKVA